jgi:hypothetical protein
MSAVHSTLPRTWVLCYEEGRWESRNLQLTTTGLGPQLQTAAQLSVTLYKSVFYISFVLFACFELVTGSLILRSTFLPRWLGWWWVAGGIGGLTFLWSPFATSIWPLLLAAGAGEFVLPVWLLIKGVDDSKWRAFTSSSTR